VAATRMVDRHYASTPGPDQGALDPAPAQVPADPRTRRLASLGRGPRNFFPADRLFGAKTRSQTMLHLVITLLIIALIAGLLGFGGIAGTAVGLAKIIFFVALVLFLVSLIFGGMRGSFGRRL
jgi:uncharacterized membrane protein YtjA (UPF0391 family)